MSAKRVVVMLCRSEDGELSVLDANGKAHALGASPAAVLNAVLDDPELPQVEDLPPDEAKVRHAAVELGKQAAPESLRPFVAPMIDTLSAGLKSASDHRQRSKRDRRKKTTTKRRRRGARRPPGAG